MSPQLCVDNEKEQKHKETIISGLKECQKSPVFPLMTL